MGQMSRTKHGKNLASMENVARRIAQIVEACSEGGKQRWAGVHHHEGRISAMDCIDPNLRAAVAMKTREELDLENLCGEFTGVTGAGRQCVAATGARRRRNTGRQGREPPSIPPFRYPWYMSWDRVRRGGGRCAHGYVTRDAARTSMP